jgi:hypothetical protein
MPEPEARSGAYEAAREAALAWLTAHWDPGLTVREWWARPPAWAVGTQRPQ